MTTDLAIVQALARHAVAGVLAEHADYLRRATIGHPYRSEPGTTHPCGREACDLCAEADDLADAANRLTAELDLRSPEGAAACAPVLVEMANRTSRRGRYYRRVAGRVARRELAAHGLREPVIVRRAGPGWQQMPRVDLAAQEPA